MAASAPPNACPQHRLSDTFHCSNEALEQIYLGARAGRPVTYLPDIDFWAVTRYEDVKAILKDTKTYTCAVAMEPFTPFSEEMTQCLRNGNFGGRSNMVANATDTHDNVRRHAQLGFTPRRLARLEPRIHELVDSAIDAFIDRGSVDLVQAMLYELPAVVLFVLLGIPESEVANVKRWADNRLLMIFGKPTPEQQIAAANELVHYWKYCLRLVAEKSANPGDDLTSDILAARADDEDALAMDDVHNIIFGLLLAGHETTSNMSANAVLALLENEGAWRRLAGNPDEIPNAVEEIIRYRPSVIAWRRKALKPVEICGTAIPEGARLLLFLASANRDEALFDEAESLQLGRMNARSHVSFGFGAHFCIGAPLARLELRIILEHLTRRLPGMRLQPDQKIEFIETVQFRGPKELHVEWGR